MSLEASNQLRQEIKDTIRRYGKESDVTVYQVLCVLEIVKTEVIEALTKYDPPPSIPPDGNQ